MKRYSYYQKFTALLLLGILAPLLAFAQDATPKKIIYETDMCLDVDDVGGLAILQALANMGEAEILAVCYNEVHQNGVATIDAINTWYGRGDIPIGIYKGALQNPDGSGYLDYVAKFPHDLESSTAPSALDVYRQVLEAQPDSSVTIISVGFLENLDDLLRADPLLIAQKVKELVIMAGVNNDNFNLSRHNLLSVSENVLRNWPTPLVISQEGSDIHTGDNLQNAPTDSPVREAFYRFFGNSFEGRPSWDEMTVLYGVRGLRNYFREITSGTGRLSNGYVWHMQPGFRSYLDGRLSSSTFERIIDELMDQRPLGAYFDVSSSSGWLPFTLHCDASITSIGARSVEKYLWNFGDGAFGEGEKVLHDYTAVGAFDVELTVIDDAGDSLRRINRIRVHDPIFSSINYFGDANNYVRNQEEIWSTQHDAGDLRFFLSNKKRNPDISLPGYCFVKDSSYSDFSLIFTARTGEELLQTKFADYSILFGYEDYKNYNYLLIKNSTSRLVNVSNGQSISIAFSSQKGMPDGDYHSVNVDLSGDHFIAMVDGSPFLTAQSARLKKTGKLGFGSTKYAVFLDDIQITRPATFVNRHTLDNVPSDITLYQNYPNPFNASTRIEFELTTAGLVKLQIFSITGEQVTTLVNEEKKPGIHSVIWNAQGVAGGLYLYQLKTPEFTATKKLLLIK